MSIKVTILEKAVQWLAGGELFKTVTDAVAIINNTELSGEEKRTAVFTEVKELFADVATVVINVVIEVAVLVLKEKIAAEVEG